MTSLSSNGIQTLGKTLEEISRLYAVENSSPNSVLKASLKPLIYRLWKSKID
jgi:hypothetical protein